MSAAATIGTTSYGFRYLLLDERLAPPLAAVLERAHQAGIEAFQICENARPLSLSDAEWLRLIDQAEGLGMELHAGCMTLDVETVARYAARAAMIPGASALRIVLEDASGRAPSRDTIERFLDAAVERTAAFGQTLVIENHFHIPCALLAEVARAYPPERVAFCIDSANSLRNWETAGQVFDLLDSRAVYYHLKDFQVHGSNVGFAVTGAPLGEGDLDLNDSLRRIFERHARPLIFLENWTPATGDRDADIAADAEWLARSLDRLRRDVAQPSYS